jgi:uncharacterized glyoxalase superfamily protein PhnB
MPLMACASPPVVPYLYYPDATEAAEFLRRAFGFVEHSAVRDDDGVLWTAQLHTGPSESAGLVMIGPALAEFGSRSVSDPDWATCRVLVLVDDLDTHFQAALASGATIRAQPAEGFGALRLYVASDCGGHQWIFAEPVANTGLSDSAAADPPVSDLSSTNS